MDHKKKACLMFIALTFATSLTECGLTNVIKNSITSAGQITAGVGGQIPNILPSPESLFESAKQVVAGYPFEFVSSSINTICTAALSSDNVKSKITPNVNDMSFVLMTPCRNYSFPLLKANELWKSTAFDPTKKTVILVTGWTTNINDTSTIETMAKAYFCRDTQNFIAVDMASFVDTLYTWSALNTEDIGSYIGKGLISLSETMSLDNIHLIGHSLGAHIVGSAGRTFYYHTGKLLPRITGLDPAKPCFKEGQSLTGLSRGDAEYVDVIHSNPGVLGKREPLGDADFYPGGLDPLPPGCFSITCAHGRAWEYFSETVYPGNEHNFMATKCNSLSSLEAKRCPDKSIPMGFAVPHNFKGNYFLPVNSKSPYGRSSNKNIILKNCGICQQ